MSCDVGEVTERLENELWCRWSDGRVGEWALLRHSSFFNSSFASLHLINLATDIHAHDLCSFSNLSVTSSTSQLILQPLRRFTYVTAHSLALPLFQLRYSSFSNPSFASLTSQALYLINLATDIHTHTHTHTLPLLILQPFRHFTYVKTHSPTLPSLYLRHSSFSSHLILQTFRHFTYVTTHSPTLPSLYLPHSSFSSQLILQPFRHFTYVINYSPTLPSRYLRHSSFSSPSVASATSQFILQPFFRFSYVTSSLLN